MALKINVLTAIALMMLTANIKGRPLRVLLINTLCAAKQVPRRAIIASRLLSTDFISPQLPARRAKKASRPRPTGAYHVFIGSVEMDVASRRGRAWKCAIFASSAAPITAITARALAQSRASRVPFTATRKVTPV